MLNYCCYVSRHILHFAGILIVHSGRDYYSINRIARLSEALNTAKHESSPLKQCTFSCLFVAINLLVFYLHLLFQITSCVNCS